MFSKNHYISVRQAGFFLSEGALIFGSIFLSGLIHSSYLYGVPVFSALFINIFLVTIVCQICLYFNNLYKNSMAWTRGGRLAIRILKSVALASGIIFVFYQIYPPVQLPWQVCLIALVVLPFWLPLWRILFGRFITRVFNSKVLIIGTGNLGKSLGREMLKKVEARYELEGFIDRDPQRIGTPVVNPQVIGDYQSLPEVIARRGIDHVVVALDDQRGQVPLDVLLAIRLRGIPVEDGISFYERITGKIAIERLKPSWLIFGSGFQKGWRILALKRAEDLILTAAGLMFLSPLFLVLAVLIRLNSPGPVFYRQERVGEGGKTFTLYKFRSMYLDAESHSGPIWAEDDDSRVTSIGRVMRMFRLDELPQMLNVIKGEMSFVGPRPERSSFVQKLREEIPYYDSRFSVRPGITGWAQVQYQYGGSTEQAREKLRYEIYYIKNMSLILDLIILMKTVKVVLSHKGAR